jgi:hypothetical protein
MKKTIFLSLIGLSSLNAATVKSSSLFNTNGTSPDTLILSADIVGVPLASGFASSGVFNLTDLEVTTLADADDIPALIAGFNGFLGSDDFATGVDFVFGIGDVPGAYAFVSSSFSPTPFIGSTLYTFIGNGADLATSTAFALYAHANTLDADPVLPTPENTPDLLLTGGSLLIGTPTTFSSTDANLGTNNTTVSAIQLEAIAPIPEPSSALLGAFGALALLRRRRN